MADPDEENQSLRQQIFILDSQLTEYRQALADSQYALSLTNAQLKLATQPTE